MPGGETRVALVTGAGKKRGIGAAVCARLASDGLDVFFAHWKDGEDEPSALLEDLREAGIRAGSREIDLSRPDSPERLLDAVTDTLGAPAVLVNNAAHSTLDGYAGLDAATLDAHYAVNHRATALLSVGFCRRFRGGAGGRIINLTSGQSLGPMPGELAYAATKGAVEAFSRTLAAEVGHLGITVNAVNPGPTDTGWMSEELKAELAARTPAGRVGTPDDAARLVSFLAGREAGWLSGQVINSEGGFVRR